MTVFWETFPWKFYLLPDFSLEICSETVAISYLVLLEMFDLRYELYYLLDCGNWEKLFKKKYFF